MEKNRSLSWLKEFLLEYWLNLLGLAVVVVILTLIVIFFREIVLFWAILVAGFISLTVAFYSLIFLLSFPFVFYLIFLGVFRHPKELVTIRTGRSLIVAGIAIIFLEIAGQVSVLPSVLGIQGVDEGLVRAYAWISIVSLLIAYSRTLYVEGYEGYNTIKSQEGSRETIVLLLPARYTISFVIDFLIPYAIASSIVVSYWCEGNIALFEAMQWIGEQFEFIARAVQEAFELAIRSAFEDATVDAISDFYESIVQRLADILSWVRGQISRLEEHLGFDFQVLNPFRFTVGCEL